MTVLGPGNDFFTTGAGDDLIDGAEGNDTLDAGAGNDTLIGNLGNDSLRGNNDPGNDQYYGGDGDDTVSALAGGGGDIADGGAGTDTIELDYRLSSGGVSLTFAPTFTVTVGGVAGIVVSNFENLKITGTNGNDSVVSGNGNDWISMGIGIDTISAGGGDDTVFVQDRFTADGGTGLDMLGLDMRSNTTGVTFGMSSLVTLAMPGFNGTATGFERVDISTGSGADSLTGAGQADYLQSNAGNDTLNGGGGDDHLSLGTGVDLAYGGSGNDDINTSTTTGAGALMYGGSGNDSLYGYQTADTLHGGVDDDQLRGNGGTDLLYGDDGNDTFQNVSAGEVYGGAGNDTVNLSLDLLAETVSGGADTDTVVAKSAGTGFAITMTKTAAGMEVRLNGTLSAVITGVEQYSVQGGTVNDSLRGGGLNDTLSGEVTVGGAADADTLQGLNGNDLLNGGDGDDVLEGGGGLDVLIGGIGKDLLTGGGGADTFRYLTAAESGPTTFDVISDFKTGSDKIDLSAIDAVPSNSAADAFRFLGASSFDGAQGALIIGTVGGVTRVSADVNGDRVADLVIELTGSIPLVATDFVL